MTGRLCYLEPVVLDHAADLFAAFTAPGGDAGWDYLAYGPFVTEAAFRDHIAAECLGQDPAFYTVIDGQSARAVGMLSYMRQRPEHGSIEIEHVHFGPGMKGSAVSTEVQYLMMRHVMTDLGYRRLEWKCDAANLRSRRAAERLGYRFEGVFRQDMVVKGRNRDTAWYALMDHEWPAVKDALEAWLAPSNFGVDGQQRRTLDDFRSNRA